MLLIMLLLAVGKGPDANKPSAVTPNYEWSVLATCPTGALRVRGPVYPGRLALVEDVGCSVDYLDVEGRRIDVEPLFDRRWAIFAVPLEWESGDTWISVCGHVSGEATCEPVPLSVGVAKYPESMIEVDKKFHKPPKEADDRIEKDRELIRLSFASAEFDAAQPIAERMSREPLWRSRFAFPCPPDFTSVFGAARVISEKGNKKSEKKTTRHLGLDFDGKVGDPILSANDGVVVLSADLYFSGNSVFISHGHGLFSSYFHMTERHVTSGQWVKKGQQLGTIGRTGRVTGPHLHFSAKLDGLYFDPIELFDLDVWLSSGS